MSGVYRIELNEDRVTCMVKETSVDYGSALASYLDVVEISNQVFHMDRAAEEKAILISVDNSLKPIALFEVAHGAVDQAIVQTREIAIRLCLSGAVKFFFVHNHPSGDLSPSKDDDDLTSKLKEMGELLSIPLLDHIIIGNGYYSYRENGRL